MSSKQDLSGLEPLDLPSGPEYTHRAHRFPGKFHPPLISKIIGENKNHQKIADPMAGSGTVGVEAVAAGREVLCVDLDPLSCLLSRAKTNPVDSKDFQSVCARILGFVGDFPESGSVDKERVPHLVEENLENTPYFKPLNMLHWFEPHIAVGYSRLLEATNIVLGIESDEMIDAVHLLLSSIVRRISRADPQPVSGLEVTKVRKQQLEDGLEFDIEKSFKQSLNRISRGYEALNEVDNLGTSIVAESNAKNFSDVAKNHDFRPTLIITSPPYCNAIEYSRRHRLEYEWLGLFSANEYEEFRKKRLDRSRDFFGSPRVLKETREELPEIPHDGIKSITDKIEHQEGEQKKANLLRKYFLDAYDWLEEIYITLPEDGLLYMTIGPSTSYGHRIDTPRFLTDIALQAGFEKITVNEYKLTNNKMQYPTNGPTTETESLLKLRK